MNDNELIDIIRKYLEKEISDLTCVIIPRNDTSSNWALNDPTLADGEYGVETDTHRVKRGDGLTAWTELPYETFGIENLIKTETEAKDIKYDNSDSGVTETDVQSVIDYILDMFDNSSIDLSSKEDKINKTSEITTPSEILYPTTKAVVDYVKAATDVAVGNYDTLKTDLEAQINAVQVNVDNTNTGLGLLKTELETSIADTKTDLETNINDTKTDLETNINTVKAELKKEIEDNEKADKEAILNLESADTDLETKINANTAGIANIDSALGVIQNDIENIDTKIDTTKTDLESKITNLDTKVETNKKDIADIGTKVDDNTKSIKALEALIPTIEGDTDSLVELFKTVASNTSAIEANKNDITSLTTRVTTSETDITDIKTKDTTQDTAINERVTKEEAKPFISNVEYDGSTCTFTFTTYDGTTKVFDLPLESAVKNGYYDNATQNLVLVLMNETEIKIPAADLVDVYTGKDTDKISLKVNADNSIEATIIEGSIAKTDLTTELQTEITGLKEKDTELAGLVAANTTNIESLEENKQNKLGAKNLVGSIWNPSSTFKVKANVVTNLETGDSNTLDVFGLETISDAIALTHKTNDSDVWQLNLVSENIDFDAQESGLTSLKVPAAIREVKGLIDTNTTNLTAVTERITTAETSIIENTNNITANTTAITELQTALSNISTKASAITFDNTDTDLQATNVQEALVEINNKIGSILEEIKKITYDNVNEEVF